MSKDIKFTAEVARLLNDLSTEINHAYGYSNEGDITEPAINLGPCGPFANAFYLNWNEKFNDKVRIAFLMNKESKECWHVLISLPNGQLFDGGVGIHDLNSYDREKSELVIMHEYDLDVLNEYSYGLERRYPRYCPDFSQDMIGDVIDKYLQKIVVL